MDVAEFFDALLFCAEVEVVVTRLPDMIFSSGFREALFENLDCDEEWFHFGFGEDQMDVVRHDYVAEDVEDVELACAFKEFAEDVTGVFGAEEWVMADATEGDEVRELGLVVASEARRHVVEFNGVGVEKNPSFVE